jgi:hypothetical protein
MAGKMDYRKNKRTWQQKLFHEFNEYLVNFIYMAIVFSAIVLYRRLVLADHGIYLEDYFAGVFNAFIIAKVVMIGAFLRISRKFEHKALIIPVLYKALLFTVWVMIFNVFEAFIRGLIKAGDLAEAFNQLKSHADLAWLGSLLLIFFCFIPFFAFKELTRVMGTEKFRGLFFKNR